MEEIRGAPVVDSEGLEYGSVSGLEVSEEGVFLRVSERVVDPTTGRELEHEKGLVPLSEVSAIAEGPGGPVVLLSTPREAEYRGVRPGPPGPADLERAVGKLVVSADGRVLGRATSVVVGPGQPGLRVSPSAVELAWLRFLRDLRRRERVEDGAVLRRIRELADEILETLRRRAEEWMRSRIVEARDRGDVIEAIRRGCIVRMPFCGREECAEDMREATGGAKVRGTRIDEDSRPTGPCAWCGAEAKEVVYVAKAY